MKCKLKECEKKSRCNGYCTRHDQQLKRTGRVWMYNQKTKNEVITEKSISRIILKDIEGNTTGETIIDTIEFEKVTKYKWCFDGRYAISTTVRPYLRLHSLILGKKKGFEIDHINRNPLDNRKENLRFVTKTQNQANKTTSKKSSSKYKGVSWNKKDQQWVVFISIKGKSKYLGMSKDEKTAAEKYNQAAKELFGEYANLNII